MKDFNDTPSLKLFIAPGSTLGLMAGLTFFIVSSHPKVKNPSTCWNQTGRS